MHSFRSVFFLCAALLPAVLSAAPSPAPRQCGYAYAPPASSPAAAVPLAIRFLDMATDERLTLVPATPALHQEFAMVREDQWAHFVCITGEPGQENGLEVIRVREYREIQTAVRVSNQDLER